MFGTRLVLLPVSCFLLLSSCVFGPNRGPRVMSYRDGRVFLTRSASYRVGELPGGWRRLRTGARAITFHHPATGASISTAAFCGAAHEDVPLAMLLGHLFSGMPVERVDPPQTLTLSGREGLRQRSLRKMDGVALRFDAVVVKKHQCTFDFVCVVPPDRYREVAPIFDAFVTGFQYE